MGQPGRKYSAGSSYRYGFNGKENDNEVKGERNQQDYGMRIYDPRLGRFLSVDPIGQAFPFYSPYQFAGNMPIWAIDLDGLEDYLVTNYYDKKGRLEETLITNLTDKEAKKLVDMKLQDANGNSLAKNKVLIRNVASNGATSYQHASNLNKGQQNIVSKAKKELFDAKVTPFAIEGGGGIGNDNGKYYTTEKEDYTTDKYQAASFRKAYDYSIPANKMNQRFDDLGGLYIGVGSILPGTDSRGNGNIKNGTFDWNHKSNKELLNTINSIKQDGEIKSISITLSFNISNATNEEYNSFKSGVEHAAAELKAKFETTGVKNITVTVNALRDNQAAATGVEVKLKK